MASPILIHIGVHKAGSSWLQARLFSDFDLGFVPLGFAPQAEFACRISAPKKLAKYFIFDSDGDLLSPFSDRSKEVGKILESSVIPEGKVGVLSAERLSGHPFASRFDAREIAIRLRNSFPQAKVLIIVREQVSAINSIYNQYVRGGGTQDLVGFVESRYDGRVPLFAKSAMKYTPLIDYYYRLFGSENVLVLPYEALVEDYLMYVNSILRFCGLNVVDGLGDVGRVNVHEGLYGALKLRMLNVFFSSTSINGYSRLSSPWSRCLVIHMRSILEALASEGAKADLQHKNTSAIRGLVGDFYVEDNAKLEGMVGLDLKSKFGYL